METYRINFMVTYIVIFANKHL